MTTSSRVVVNVGGKKHEILAEKIKRHPQTRLGMLLASTNLDKIDSLCDGFHFETQEYFFDRSSVYFEVIIDFYRLGTIHLPNGVCVVEFEVCYINDCPSHFISFALLMHCRKI